MSDKPALKLTCPICKKPVQGTDPNSPFCSDRCRSIDLGKWASGAYSIPYDFDEIEDRPGEKLREEEEEE